MLETNGIDRVPYVRDPALEFDIFGPEGWDDLILAPDGEMRSPLIEGAKYTVHNTHVIPQMFVPKATSFTTFAPTEIVGARLAVSLLIPGTAGVPYIWGREVGVFATNRVSAVDISDSGNGEVSTLFDLTGGTAFSSWLSNLFAPINFKKLGSFVDIGINTSNSAWSNNIQGIVQRFSTGNALFNQVETLVFNGLFGGTMIKPMHSIIGEPIVMLQLGNSVELKTNDPLYHVDSEVPSTSNLVFSSHPYAGLSNGDFFRDDVSLGLTAMSQQDSVIDSFSDSTVNPGVDTTVNTAVRSNFTKGMIILIADEAAYDGLQTVVRVADDELSFDINVVFSTSGAGTLKSTRFTTATNNPIVEGETSVISGTTAYNGTLNTLFVGDNTFDLPIAFVTDEATGTVVSTGKNAKSLGLTSIGNGAQADSRSLAEARINGVLTVDGSGGVDVAVVDIVPTAGDWIEDATTERFSVNTTTGIITYNDTKDITKKISFQVSATPTSGGNQVINFDIHISGVQQTKSITTIDTANTNDANYVGGFFDLVSGDTIQLFKGNVTNTNDTDVSVTTLLIE